MNRTVLAAAASLAFAFLLGLLFVLWNGAPRSPRAGLETAAPGARAESAPLLDKLDATLRRVEALELELAALRAGLQELRTSERVPVAPPTSSGAPAAATDEARDAHWYLERYVASFEGGGRGSEYFRLAVQAYVTELVDPVCQLVLQRGRPTGLRAGLSGVLGDGRLIGDDRVVGTLSSTLSQDEPAQVVASALRSLREIAGKQHLATLLACVWRLQASESRTELLRLVLDLTGDTPNATLALLLRSAPDAAAEAELIALMRAFDLEGALELFALASYRERDTRLAAAVRTHEFRGDRTLALVDEWAAREPDEEVRRALVGAREQLTTLPPWHAEQVVGAPNAADPSRDSREAWAPGTADGGREWIEVTYQPAVRASEVRVHEVCSAGGVAKVTLVDEAGGRHVVWEGVDPLTAPGVFAIPFAPTAYRVRAVRLEIETGRRGGWDEIDAVELVGPDGPLWASGASASSTYGQGQQTFELSLGKLKAWR
jgi:hypothetical protein